MFPISIYPNFQEYIPNIQEYFANHLPFLLTPMPQLSLRLLFSYQYLILSSFSPFNLLQTSLFDSHFRRFLSSLSFPPLDPSYLCLPPVLQIDAIFICVQNFTFCLPPSLSLFPLFPKPAISPAFGSLCKAAQCFVMFTLRIPFPLFSF